MTKAAYKSELREAMHSSAKALYKVGAIDETTMREFDEACLSAVPELAPQDIRRLRKANKVS